MIVYEFIVFYHIKRYKKNENLKHQYKKYKILADFYLKYHLNIVKIS